MMRMFLTIVLVLSATGASSSVGLTQTPATRELMREKLQHSQRVLEAIMTSDFKLLDRESVALARVTRAPAWQVLKSPQYVRYSANFARAAEELGEAARDFDLDEAAIRYTSLTMTCYSCHRYMKGARIVR